MEIWCQKFRFIIHSTVYENNDEHQQSYIMFTEMMNEIPNEMAVLFFQYLSNVEKEQEKSLILVLFGRFLYLILINQILLSEETVESIKFSFLSFFENDDFTQNQFDIISNDILLLLQYDQYNWPELPELLFNTIVSNNLKASTSAADCLSQCIKNYYIDIECYFDELYEYVFDFLYQLNESYIPKISAFLRLFYSLANFHYFEPIDNFIPILNDLPNILQLTLEDHQIIKDFYSLVKFDSFNFHSSFQSYFDVFVDMISDENYICVGNTIILTLNKLISSFYSELFPQSNSIFAFYADNLNQTEYHDVLKFSLNNLSKLYGDDEKFAINVFEYLKKQINDPISYIAFSSCFEGIKGFFINSEISDELLSIFSNGLSSEDESFKVIVLQSLSEMISNIPQNDSSDFIEKSFLALYNNMNEEDFNHFEIIYSEIKILKKLLKKFTYKLQDILIDVIQMLDELIYITESIEFIATVFDCYRYIATFCNEEFIPFSEKLILKMSQYINDPNEYEFQFFLCIEILPFLKNSIDENVFNEFLINSFSFLFDEIYDENGEENENYILSKNERCNIINFLLFSIGNEEIMSIPEIVDRIIFIAYKSASDKPEFEVIGNNYDISTYKNCIIMANPNNDETILIGNDQITKINNSIAILTSIFTNDDIELTEDAEKIKELIPQLLETPFITKIISYNDFNEHKNI